MAYKDKQKQKEIKRQIYIKNKEKYYENSRKSKMKYMDVVQDIKKYNKCYFCKEDEPICLDLHHIDPNLKDKNMAKIVSHSGMIKILKEIVKCVTVCANCHRKLHKNILIMPNDVKPTEILWDVVESYYGKEFTEKLKKKIGP